MINRLKPYFLIAPTLLLILLIMGVGVLNCITQSLGYFPQIGMKEVSLNYYIQIFTDKTFLRSLMFSLKTSIVSSSISIILGVLFAYILSKNKYTKIRNSLVNLPIIIPHIVVVIFMISIFSQSGIISRVLYTLGIIKDSSEFFNIVIDKNGLGVILVYLWKGIPFVIITTYQILKSINDKLEIVALNLGANKLQSFMYVTLPLSMPTIMSTFIILLTFSFGSYEVPFLIGPTTPKALPVVAYINYISSDLSKRSVAMATNMILSGISFVMLIIYNKIFNKIYRYKL